ncbi:MAG: PEP/pyruvate-binding domain-containing protein, partial [Ilumatobacteraceae bacterium]
MTGTTSGAGARPLMIRLDDRDPGAVDPDLVGGKAAALARLVRSGHPVPDGVVLTTEAYRRSIPAGGPIDPEGPPADDAEIDRWFDDRELPGEVRSIVDRIAADAGGLLAVRSSATGEDAALAAFPGQYRSLLDVAPDELGAALRRVWASLWHGAPRA